MGQAKVQKKESFDVLSTSDPYGGCFEFLGAGFDEAFTTEEAVEEVVVNWKFKMNKALRQGFRAVGRT